MARRRVVGLAFIASLLLPAWSSVGPAAAREGVGSGQPAGAYVVSGVRTREERSAVAATGAGIEEVRADAVLVRAQPAERDAIVALGFTVAPAPPFAPAGPSQAKDFPPADSNYHSYAETLADLDAVALAHPGTVRRFSIGSSYEGRDLAAVRISNDALDTGVEPAVLFVGLHHAREHLTTEVVLSLVHLFAESADPAVRSLVDNRQIYVLPQLNPDGGEYDVASGSYAFWRKNRQPNSGSPYVGTDLNRNYGYRWGCCGGSSGSFSSETYRGTTPFSAPESNAMRLFVESRPNLRTAISYHSYGDLILYPYGYTYADLPADLAPLDRDAFVAMASQMASTTGYTAQQASDLYITDGDWGDWLYGARHVFGFTFELSGSGYGFYPPDELIAAEVNKNRDAAIYAATMAACPSQAAGATCPAGPFAGLRRIQSLPSGQYLSIGRSSAGIAPIVLSPFVDSDRQRWSFEPTGSGTYRLRNRGTDKVAQAGTRRSSPLVSATDTGAPAQQWRTESSGGSWRIVSAASGYCLDNYSSGGSSILTVRPCDGNPAQLWNVPPA